MRDHRRFYSNPISVWQDRLLPIADRAIAPWISTPIYPKVMLARLAAGAVIDRHVDGGGSISRKIHVPIQSSDRALI